MEDKMPVTEKLAQYAVDTKYDDIPEKTIQYAKELALSNIASMTWASTLPAGKIVIGMVKEMGGTPEAGVIGGGFKTSAVNATLANGSFAHTAEWEGDSRPEMVGAMTIFPVVFPLGEKLGLSGKDVLEAAIVAHEIQARIGLACLPATERGFFAVPVFGNFGAAAATAKLLKLDVGQVTTAISIAASQAAGTLRQHSTMAHFVETGFACRNGVMAAMLAREGINADTNILEDSDRGVGFCTAVAGKEGFHIEKLTESLGREFRTDFIDTKHYACHSQQQRPIEAVLHLLKKHDISYDDIASVEVEVNQGIAHEVGLIDPPDGEHTRVSIYHGIAAAMLEGKIGLDTFTEEKRVSPKFKEARSKVKLTIHPEWPNNWPEGYDIITARLKDGKEYSTKWETFKGYHKTPLSREDLIAKFKDGTRNVLSPSQADRVMELVLNLEKVNDVSELMNILAFPSQ